MKRWILSIIAVSTLLFGAMEDDPFRASLLADRFEMSQNNGERLYNWEVSIMGGYDMNRLYLYSAGEADQNGIESSKNELVYSRAIAPFWDIQVGIAQDTNGALKRNFFEAALMGLAPYWFETRAVIGVDQNGALAFWGEAEYELLLTQRLILTPSIEIEAYSKGDLAMQRASGLSKLEAGFRLRYEIKREFAPYIGLHYERTLGGTYDLLPINDTRLVAGVRFWF